jgi:hypothetical protein
MASNRVNMDHMTSGSTYGSIRQLNSIITTAPKVVLNPPVVENYHGGGWFVGGTQNRNNQKQFHILLAGEKTARETFWSCFIPLGQLLL